MRKINKVYLVLNKESNLDNEYYWEQYNSLEDAVCTRGDGCEVYLAVPKLLGKFKRKAEIVKIKVRKKKVKK